MDEVPPDISNLGPHFTETPYFIILVVVAAIVLGLVLRLAFNHNSKEYKYDPDKD